jgi:deoxyhypusine synthase
MTTFETADKTRTSEEAVLLNSSPIPEGSVPVRGFDFSSKVDLDTILSTYASVGFQATNFGSAVRVINEMVLTS